MAVYGSRNLKKHKSASSIYSLGAWLLTFIGNLIYNQRLTDQYTCYKLIRTDILKKMWLESKGFEVEAEITAKLSRLGYKIKELPITYQPRNKKEGKKIKLKDAFKGFLTLLKYRCWRPAEHFSRLDKFFRLLRCQQIKKLIKTNDNVLDIGCGTIVYLHSYLLKQGIQHTYTGLDRRPSEHFSEHHLIINHDLDNSPLPIPNATFDKITLLTALEHLTNPNKITKECFRILKPRGLLIITTPTPAAKKILEVLAKFKLIDQKEIAEHQHCFTPSALIKLLIDNGFNQKNITTKYFEGKLNLLTIASK